MKKNFNKGVLIALAFAIALVIALVPVCSAANGTENTAPTTAPTTAPAADVHTGDTAAEHAHSWAIVATAPNAVQLRCNACESVISLDTANTLCKHEFVATDNGGLCEVSCTKCNYFVLEPHTWGSLMPAYWGHLKTCITCGLQEIHEVTRVIDVDGHHIMCNECDAVASISHERKLVPHNEFFHKFVCPCGYESMEVHSENCGCLSTYGVITEVEKVNENGKRFYRVTILEKNGESVTYPLSRSIDLNFDEDDFVVVKIVGDLVTDVSVLVDGDITDDLENFADYLGEKIDFSPMENVTLDDLVIDEFFVDDDLIEIEFASERLSLTVYDSYVVYDLAQGEIGELHEGATIIYHPALSQGEVTAYFIVVG